MLNPSPVDFLETLTSGIWLPGRIPVYTTTLRKGRQCSHWCFNPREVDRYCSRYFNSRQVLFGIGRQSAQHALAIARRRRPRAVLGSIRGCEAAVTALSALWVEIPYLSPDLDTGPAVPLPPGPEQALSLLHAIDQRASIVISKRTASGGCFYALWLLSDPWVFDPDVPASAEKTEAKDLLCRLQWAVAERAAGSGWHLEVSGDLATAFPLPGFATGASAKGPRATVEAFPLLDGEGRYRRSDFESLPEAPTDTLQPWRRLLERPADSCGPQRHIYDFEPIADGCSWIRHCLSDRATLDGEELTNAVELLIDCAAPGADNARLIHMVCGDHPGYDPQQVDRQIAALLRKSSSPITCPRIGSVPGVETRYCAGCSHFGRIESPIELALEAEAPSEASSGEAVSEPPSGDKSSDTLVSALEPAPEPSSDSRVVPSSTAPDGRPIIVITTDQHEVNDQALAVLAAAGVLFEHAGSLVELIPTPDGSPKVHLVRAPRLRELFCRHCIFVTLGSDGELRPVNPPSWLVSAVMNRGHWPELPRFAEALDNAGGAEALSIVLASRAARHLDHAADALVALEKGLADFGGAATTRRIAEVLATEADRFPCLAKAIQQLIPDFDPGDPRAASVLGYRFRNLRDHVFADRALIQSHRTRDGIAWAVESIPTTSDSGKEAIPS